MQNVTVPMAHFEVQDASGRRYRVTRYVWLVGVGEGKERLWREHAELLMTDQGGYVHPLPDGRFEIDGTETVVERAVSFTSLSH